MKQFDGFRKLGIDMTVEESIEEHCRKYDITPLNAVKLFPVLARRQWLKRILAHAELFKLTLEVPGDIVDLGVFRGSSLLTWANLLEIYSIGDRTKYVYGFDNWRGFVQITDKDGKEFSEVDKFQGGFSPENYYEELKSAINIFDNDRFIPWKDRIKLVEGNIEEIIPKFIVENSGIRFSLINFDCDLYEPTKTGLEYFWPRLSRGGVALFDEYAMHEWEGESNAVDEYFKDKDVEIKTFSWTNSPGAYVIKK